MNPPDATPTNGRDELPGSARSVLVLADPPEASWRMKTPSDEQAVSAAELAAHAG